jgi:hypothetical protein
MNKQNYQYLRGSLQNLFSRPSFPQELLQNSLNLFGSCDDK